MEAANCAAPAAYSMNNATLYFLRYCAKMIKNAKYKNLQRSRIRRRKKPSNGVENFGIRPSDEDENSPPITRAQTLYRVIESIYKLRRSRDEVFENNLFSDTAWDILLFLYISHCQNHSPTVSQVCNASGSPSTTALRHIEILCQSGLLVKKGDPLDGRRAFLALTTSAKANMERLFEAIAIPQYAVPGPGEADTPEVKILKAQNYRLKRLLADAMLENSELMEKVEQSAQD